MKSFGCKLVRLGLNSEQEHFDPIERNDVKTLETLWGDESFRAQYLSNHRKQLYRVVLEKLQALEMFNSNFNLLDVGCGPGFFPRLIKDEGFPGAISGCDFSEQAVSLSESLVPEGRFFKQDIYDPIEDSYEVIVCMETLEHLLHPDRAVRNLAAAAPVLILTVPEGRKDTFRGHLNFWSKDSFEVFLNDTLPEKNIEVNEVADERNLLAKIC